MDAVLEAARNMDKPHIELFGEELM